MNLMLFNLFCLIGALILTFAASFPHHHYQTKISYSRPRYSGIVKKVIVPVYRVPVKTIITRKFYKGTSPKRHNIGHKFSSGSLQPGFALHRRDYAPPLVKHQEKVPSLKKFISVGTGPFRKATNEQGVSHQSESYDGTSNIPSKHGGGSKVPHGLYDLPHVDSPQQDTKIEVVEVSNHDLKLDGFPHEHTDDHLPHENSKHGSEVDIPSVSGLYDLPHVDEIPHTSNVGITELLKHESKHDDAPHVHSGGQSLVASSNQGSGATIPSFDGLFDLPAQVDNSKHESSIGIVDSSDHESKLSIDHNIHSDDHSNLGTPNQGGNVADISHVSGQYDLPHVDEVPHGSNVGITDLSKHESKLDDLPHAHSGNKPLVASSNQGSEADIPSFDGLFDVSKHVDNTHHDSSIGIVDSLDHDSKHNNDDHIHSNDHSNFGTPNQGGNVADISPVSRLYDLPHVDDVPHSSNVGIVDFSKHESKLDDVQQVHSGDQPLVASSNQGSEADIPSFDDLFDVPKHLDNTHHDSSIGIVDSLDHDSKHNVDDHIHSDDHSNFGTPNQGGNVADISPVSGLYDLPHVDDVPHDSNVGIVDLSKHESKLDDVQQVHSRDQPLKGQEKVSTTTYNNEGQEIRNGIFGNEHSHLGSKNGQQKIIFPQDGIDEIFGHEHSHLSTERHDDSNHGSKFVHKEQTIVDDEHVTTNSNDNQERKYVFRHDSSHKQEESTKIDVYPQTSFEQSKYNNPTKKETSHRTKSVYG